MALYFLTYDLRSQGNYQTLYDALQGFNAVRILESTWCFNRAQTDVEGVRDYFKGFIDSDDGMIVSHVAAWASFNTDGTPEDLA